jgi:hypothetical protein
MFTMDTSKAPCYTGVDSPYSDIGMVTRRFLGGTQSDGRVLHDELNYSWFTRSPQ